MEFKVGESVLYRLIDMHFDTEEWDMVEHGPEIVGEHFIVFSSLSNSRVISFMLDGATGRGYTYKCIYNE